VIFLLIRNITWLRKIYTFYSNIGYEESPDNTYIMNRMQFWRFMKDCHLHHNDMTLMEMDRVLGITDYLGFLECAKFNMKVAVNFLFN
jgi:hypothetical protein